MTFPTLQISKNVKSDKPIIQGGMAIRVSTAKLAAAVANCGGIGVIAASGLSKEELFSQIKLARDLTVNKGGLIGVNIMYAAAEFKNLVNWSIEANIDLIIFGAGFSRDIFSLGRKANVPVVPIVSSAKLAVAAKKLGASAIIVESGEAGGHLGTCEPIRTLIPEIKKALDETPNYPGIKKVSLIAAGGVTSGKDIKEMLSLGADGVQMATRFVLSEECEVSPVFKKLFLNTKDEEVVLIKSPVGLPARAILTPFSKKIIDGTVEKPKICDACLKQCSHNFCIIRALEAARKGDLEHGLFFTGGNVTKYKDIICVKEIFKRLEEEAESKPDTKTSETLKTSVN